MTQASNGILPDHEIATLFEQGAISAQAPLADKQIQPASIDVRLGAIAYRVRASFLPGVGRNVEQCLKDLTLHTIDISQGAVLETGCVYIVPLLESLNLPPHISAAANPKSSTGRLDVFTRIIANESQAFDTVPAGYKGALYAEISPRTFPIMLRTGSRLSQLRFRVGKTWLSDDAVRALDVAYSLTPGSTAKIEGGLQVGIDLSEGLDAGIIGYRARRHTGVIDIDKVGGYQREDFFEPLRLTKQGSLVLDPGQFYILASSEKVHIPPTVASEMVAIDPLMGEFRVHYAGFFDPGFGHMGEGKNGSKAVLEVRSHDVPFVLEHGQSVARLVFENLTSPCKTLYGVNGSNYQGQRLKLAKHFV